MAIEIERKFLVANDSWRRSVTGIRKIRQAYLTQTDLLSFRIRLVSGEGAWLTMKSGLSGASRHEYEYPIPERDAEELIELRQGAIIAKSRHHIPQAGLTWEVDVFEGENAGLLLAEIELPDELHAFDRPDWLGKEVTHDPRFYNSALSRYPYAMWRDA